MKPNPLPNIMVAPNGARRGKADHPALPITDTEMVATAIACQQAGADGIHLHIRDDAGNHLLDALRYKDLLDELGAVTPDLYLQVTSEAAGRYSACEQRDMVQALCPDHVSVAMREMVPKSSDWDEASDFYNWAFETSVDIQHILYTPLEVRNFVIAINEGKIPGTNHLIQLVQGKYTNDANGVHDSKSLVDYLYELNQAEGMSFDWMVCAFGKNETVDLVRAVKMGGKIRVGFENSLWNADGKLAEDNAERVRLIHDAVRNL